MDLSLIHARLKEQLTGLRSVGLSADLESAYDGVLSLPAAFVLPLSETAETMELIGRTEQRVAQAFGVVLGLVNSRDAKGAAALNDLHPHCMALRSALVGWVPDASNGEPVTFTAGRLLRLDGDGRLWWIDEFELKSFYWRA